MHAPEQLLRQVVVVVGPPDVVVVVVPLTHPVSVESQFAAGAVAGCTQSQDPQLSS